MELTSTNGSYSFDPTPRLKSSPVPILFISFGDDDYNCNYCKSKFSLTSTFQLYCKNCVFDYVNKLNDYNTYLDVHISTEEAQCIEHEPRNFYTQNSQEWCKNCSRISRFHQVVNYKFSSFFLMDYKERYEIIKCKLCGYEIESSLCPLCPNCYLISSEWIESTLDKKPIPTVYLPWWDDSSDCLCCQSDLIFKSDCQKWCSRCFTVYTGCRYCLTTNVIFGITKQSKCKKCKRVVIIDINNNEYNLEDYLIYIRLNTSNHNYIFDGVNNIDQKLGFVESVYELLRQRRRHYLYKYPVNNHYPMKANGQIHFISFSNMSNKCNYCGNNYSSTLLFEQKYCKYCLFWYIKCTKFTTQNMIGVYIITSKTQCTEHEPRKLNFCTQDIQEWCINCSEISYFKQIITRDSFDKKIIQSEKCNICENTIDQQISLMCPNCYLVSSGYLESTLTKKPIPILYLPWWDDFNYCTGCEEKFDYKYENTKWCLRCVIIYNRCRYCFTTNVIFGFTNQSQCIKCERVEHINIDENNNIYECLNSTIGTNKEIASYVNNIDKNSNPLEIYDFIKNQLNDKNMKMIEYSTTKNFRRIAEGGFGVIYEAIWEIYFGGTKVVAVKRFLNSQNISKYFINELKSFNQYRNRFKHVIKYYGITQDPNTREHMIIMQYADGGDLHNYLQENFKNVTWKEKLSIILEISRGVDFIHKENFIHRDLHSGNILLINGKWHIGDFGLSRPANIASSNNEIYGVIPYVAPEIFNGHTFSKESDIYSFGMIMWELTSGCKPFLDCNHDIHLIYKIIDGIRPEITNDSPDCFCDLINKCWDPDPSKRPHIKEIRKTVGLWAYMMKDIDHFNQAEKIRLKLIEEKKLGNKFTTKIHPGAIYTSRLLNSSTSISSSISSSSKTSFDTEQKYISKDLEFDINNAKGNKFYHSELIEYSATKYDLHQSNKTRYVLKYISKEIELDINDA
ncbi:hypothetical protein RclHR1_00590029 [Rhizophagus clarus]|uniref:Protein kinase domain-containing protein n=1 Tax=Rhizophagus clarus TaxID=94130 RepID=A0A2Z6RVG0_9GLOM|nr:hypothetical protein RclHR1_00590029 [Rhizophagus clarus]